MNTCRLPEPSNFRNLKWIPSTSNVVERLFSRMKLIYSDRRRSILPARFESAMILIMNRDLWSIDLVNTIWIQQQQGEYQIIDSESESESEL